MADPRAGKPSYRSQKMRAAYTKYIEAGKLAVGCALCDKEADGELLENFNLWQLVDNRFPYDTITDTHHMLMPKAHITEEELTPEHLSELRELKQTILNDRYTFIFETLPNAKSIPPHHHLHLIVVKNL